MSLKALSSLYSSPISTVLFSTAYSRAKYVNSWCNEPQMVCFVDHHHKLFCAGVPLAPTYSWSFYGSMVEILQNFRPFAYKYNKSLALLPSLNNINPHPPFYSLLYSYMNTLIPRCLYLIVHRVGNSGTEIMPHPTVRSGKFELSVSYFFFPLLSQLSLLKICQFKNEFSIPLRMP